MMFGNLRLWGIIRFREDYERSVLMMGLIPYKKSETMASSYHVRTGKEDSQV
jgi:hypothetical protein